MRRPIAYKKLKTGPIGQTRTVYTNLGQSMLGPSIRQERPGLAVWLPACLASMTPSTREGGFHDSL